ncbi:methyl-accepting chemotaxis protein [Pseudodesulfovibrio piezophilus]|uniref:Methyl-accepting chemotaxis sensory transducer n=1 Tax=Pseudodesulfovibrio piezophilus (strain DSM 21447 / JCM 15486 / C1TLV30) TaxID=1322246 RepID=M1WTL6_PSEP2|nr:methyl-accepting chemotaxis protein [Pseudodesulfovibrio piezophilus]CCH49717.1 Methyl-accepting chemotaxis sensory transducer [Pseudodesulfovibrio piezophilus C1TLV30]
MFENVSLKYKILALAIAGPVIMATVLVFQQVSQISKAGREDILHQSRAVILMAEAARDEMSKKLNMGVIKPFEEFETKEKLLEAVPIITAINMAQLNADKLDYKFRAPKVSPRNPINTPTELELQILDKLKAENLEEYLLEEEHQIRYFRPIRLSKECLYCHGDPKGSTDPAGGTREGWKEGEIHGAFEIIASLDAAQAKIVDAKLFTAVETMIILLLIGAASWFLVNLVIVSPLFRIRNFAQSVAEGELTATPEGSFSAELRIVKDAIAKMVENLKEKMLEAAQQKEEAEVAKGKAETAMSEAKEQEDKANSLLTKMQHVAHDASLIAEQVTSAADQLSSQADQVSNGAEVQRERTSQTATAMEEMNATVLEVAQNSASSASSAQQAKDQAQEGARIVKDAIQAISEVHQLTATLKGSMDQLGTQTTDIGQIMNVIEDIADQTNLLALNAAIEAARAGEAGRGFAVVADEVRKLAEKTMDATKQVGTAIQTIQDGAAANIRSVDTAATAVERATELANQSGASLSQIVEFADETSGQVQSIATAAEEQSAASEEINQAVDDINMIASETVQGMNQSASAITELVKLSNQLRALIDEMNS